MKNRGVVEIFAGIGGLAQAFVEEADLELQALFDIDPAARLTYLTNRPAANYLLTDLSRTSPKKLYELAGGKRPFAVLGCPPCQGLSAVGTRDPKDPRNTLIRRFFSFVLYARPKVFILENVPQVLTDKNYKNAIARFAENGNYRCWSGVLNCALYGLPQMRQRAVVIGYHKSLGVTPTMPPPTHYGRRRFYSYADAASVRPQDDEAVARGLGWYAFGASSAKKGSVTNTKQLLRLKPLVTLADALGDLPSAGRDKYASEPKTTYQRRMRTVKGPISNHEPWGHDVKTLKRLSRIPEGGALFAKNGGARSQLYFSQAYTRLHRKGLARTITVNFHNAGCGRFVHYKKPRTLTVREAARLQGFEDWFVFAGYPSDQRRLVGNAFPKVLGRALARHVASQLKLSP